MICDILTYFIHSIEIISDDDGQTNERMSERMKQREISDIVRD